MSRLDHITIVGAGLVGSLLACRLAKAGFEVSLYERRNDPRAAGFVGGRSINLAISARGIAALREAGLADEVLKAAIPMPGRMIHGITGDLHFQAYSKNPGDHINSVSRSELNLILLRAAAAHRSLQLFFDHRCTSIDFKPARPIVSFEKPDGSILRVETDRILAGDGAFSAVRLQMMLNMDRFDYRQDYLAHGYKELQIPPACECGVDPNLHDGWAMEPKALHIWPRGGSMMIALPNPDRSFTCTCFWPFAGPHGFDRLRSEADVMSYFKDHYPDAVPLMPALAHDFMGNPTSALVTVRCSPWHLGDKALLMGDAAHAIVPFYGQGANAGFEDVSAFMRCVDAHRGDWGRIFTEFNALRKPNTDAIADMALENFIEMRDKTASPLFRWKKKLEHGLHALLPGWFHPLYDMISFSTIPYAQARARARHQTQVIALIGAMFLFAGIALFATILIIAMT